MLAGAVWSGDRRLDKPGTASAEDEPLELRGRDHPWVSRGGLKLAHALDHFAIDPAGLVALDIGASTGGFTDVLLSRGARRVYAVDVGHGQLAWKLRNDPRVVVLRARSMRATSPRPTYPSRRTSSSATRASSASRRCCRPRSRWRRPARGWSR